MTATRLFCCAPAAETTARNTTTAITIRDFISGLSLPATNICPRHTRSQLRGYWRCGSHVGPAVRDKAPAVPIRAQLGRLPERRSAWAAFHPRRGTRFLPWQPERSSCVRASLGSGVSTFRSSLSWTSAPKGREKIAHGASHGNIRVPQGATGGAKEPFQGELSIFGHEEPSYAPTGLARTGTGSTGLTPWASMRRLVGVKGNLGFGFPPAE